MYESGSFESMSSTVAYMLFHNNDVVQRETMMSEARIVLVMREESEEKTHESCMAQEKHHSTKLSTSLIFFLKN